MANWLVVSLMLLPLPVGRHAEARHEDLRYGRIGSAQLARIYLVQFTDDHRHLRRRCVIGGHAFARNWFTTTRWAASAEVWAVRHCRSSFAARPARFQSRTGRERSCTSREPRTGPNRDAKDCATPQCA